MVEDSALNSRAFVDPYVTRGRKLDVKKNDAVRVDLEAIARPQ
jgi:hypothetical protein